MIDYTELTAHSRFIISQIEGEEMLLDLLLNLEDNVGESFSPEQRCEERNKILANLKKIDQPNNLSNVAENVLTFIQIANNPDIINTYLLSFIHKIEIVIEKANKCLTIQRDSIANYKLNQMEKNSRLWAFRLCCIADIRNQRLWLEISQHIDPIILMQNVVYKISGTGSTYPFVVPKASSLESKSKNISKGVESPTFQSMFRKESDYRTIIDLLLQNQYLEKRDDKYYWNPPEYINSLLSLTAFFDTLDEKGYLKEFDTREQAANALCDFFNINYFKGYFSRYRKRKNYSEIRNEFFFVPKKVKLPVTSVTGN